MTTRSETDQRRAPIPVRSNELIESHERMLRASAARSRFIENRSGRRIHVIETGAEDGPAVVLLHGSSTSSLSLLPVLERLEGVRAIAVDRPGFGLSDPVRVPRERFRDAAVAFVDEIADELNLEAFAVAGNSMGGTWALWYALARPGRVTRLVLLGSAPLLPGTRAPAPLRLMATPVLGSALSRLLRPSPKTVVRLMSAMGEADTIVRYPELINSVVAAGRDPIASAVNLAELRAAITLRGFRSSMLVTPDELRRVAAPTLLIWGDHDPVGAVEAAWSAARSVPNASVEVLPAGHVPYLRDPQRVAELLSGFVSRST